jgi:ornithine--oxo-acid transaminase
LTKKDHDTIISAFDSTIGETHKMGGAIWDLGKNLAGHALKK